MEVLIYHYDAFSSIPGKGNPAGVVLNAPSLSTEQMQSIARHVGFNETAFVCPSEVADLRLRYFTPGHEMNLCGHATIATCYALIEQQLLPAWSEQSTLTVETLAGIMPITLKQQADQLQITMQQARAQFEPFEGSAEAVARALGLAPSDLDMRYPIVYASTGIWTLLVPIRHLAAFARMEPLPDQFPDLLPRYPRASLHPFSLETYDCAAQMHGRHFSSPFSGTCEDAVTGTASGAMGAYYVKYISPSSSAQLVVEQGFELQRDGRVQVAVKRTPEAIAVTITGTATYVRQWLISVQ